MLARRESRRSRISTGSFGRLFPSNVLFRPVYHKLRRLLCPASSGAECGGTTEEFSAISSVRKRERSAACWLTVILALEKLGSVELLVGFWRTAPHHSRMGRCIQHADIDAEDQPGRDPQ